MECQLTIGSCGKAGWMVKEPINFKVLSWWTVSEMRIKKAWMWPIWFCFFSLHFLYFIPNSTILWGTQAVFISLSLCLQLRILWIPLYSSFCKWECFQIVLWFSVCISYVPLFFLWLLIIYLWRWIAGSP